MTNLGGYVVQFSFALAIISFSLGGRLDKKNQILLQNILFDNWQVSIFLNRN